MAQMTTKRDLCLQLTYIVCAKGGRLDATRVGYTFPKAQLFMKLNIFDGDTEMIHIFETHCTILAI